MDKTEDKLWLTIFTKEDGSIRYGCRMTSGPRYKELYKWLQGSTSYVSSSEDFPWDFFYFKNPRDELEFITRYESEIHEV